MLTESYGKIIASSDTSHDLCEGDSFSSTLPEANCWQITKFNPTAGGYVGPESEYIPKSTNWFRLVNIKTQYDQAQTFDFTFQSVKKNVTCMLSVTYDPTKKNDDGNLKTDALTGVLFIGSGSTHCIYEGTEIKDGVPVLKIKFK